MALLEIKDVCKYFDNKEVLKGVSLTVNKGDVVSILGASGSGKTTFLRCINFLENADEGVMIFDEKEYDLKSASRKEMAQIRKKTGFVFQNYNLFANKTVLENVTLGLTSGRKIPEGIAKDRAVKVLDKVGMAD